jgi:hypothetical protein
MTFAGGSNSRCRPGHRTKDRCRAFSNCQPKGPVKNASSDFVTTPTTSATPTMPPTDRWRGIEMPNCSSITSTGTSAQFWPAWIKRGPRYAVVHERFSIVLMPLTIMCAQGWRTDRTFILDAVSRYDTNRNPFWDFRGARKSRPQSIPRLREVPPAMWLEFGVARSPVTSRYRFRLRGQLADR